MTTRQAATCAIPNHMRLITCLLLALLALHLVPAGAMAQHSDAHAEESAQLNPRLTAKPMAIEPMHLSVHPPAGAEVQQARPGANQYQILFSSPIINEDGLNLDPEKRPKPAHPPANTGYAWTISIHATPSTTAAATPQQAAEHIANAILKETNKGDRKLNRNKGNHIGLVQHPAKHPSAIDTRHAAWVDLHSVVVNADGHPIAAHDPKPTRSIVAIEPEPGRLIILEYFGNAADTAGYQMFTDMVASIHFDDKDSRRTELGILLSTGKRFFESLSDQDLDAALRDDQLFYRLYMPAADEPGSREREVGFQRIEIRRGQFGELQKHVSPDNWDATEREMGMTVHIRTRMIHPVRADIAASFFLSRNQQFEGGNILTTVTDPRTGLKDTANETFYRRGDRITVSVDRPGEDPSVLESFVPEGEYISRPLLYMLPRLAAAKAQPNQPLLFEMGFYHFHSNDQQVALRTDTIEHTATGRWTYTSKPTKHAAEVVTTLDNQGDILRRTLPGGQIMQRIERDELLQLWKSKGLPVR